MAVLTNTLAQKVIDQIRNTIPYNINIIDDKGMIIASSDLTRIGQMHEAGLSALRENRTVTVEADDSNMRKGTNMPFYYHGQPIGVIGISGEIKDTQNIILLVRCAVELLVEQECAFQQRQTKKRLKEQFLYEWLSLEDCSRREFAARGQKFNIDVTLPRRVLVGEVEQGEELTDITMENLWDALVSGESYYLRLEHNKFAFMVEEGHVDSFLTSMDGAWPGMVFGVGECCPALQASLLQAQSALQLGRQLFPQQRRYDYQRLRYFDHGLRYLITHPQPVAPAVQELFSAPNSPLVNTLLTYFRCSGNTKQTAEILHLHRNSVNYHLCSIARQTGLDPRCYVDLFTLVSAYLHWLQTSSDIRR